MDLWWASDPRFFGGPGQAARRNVELFVAFGLTALIGLERELQGKSAGIRTQARVVLTSSGNPACADHTGRHRRRDGDPSARRRSRLAVLPVPRAEGIGRKHSCVADAIPDHVSERNQFPDLVVGQRTPGGEG